MFLVIYVQVEAELWLQQAAAAKCGAARGGRGGRGGCGGRGGRGARPGSSTKAHPQRGLGNPAPAPEPVPAPAPVPEPAPALAPELYEKQLRAAPSALLYGAVALLRRQDGGTAAATLVPQQQFLLAVPASTP